jgi:hypothetical protein
VAFDIAVYDSQIVHVLKYSSGVQGHFYPLPKVELNLVFLHVEQTKQTLVHVLKYNHNVGNLGHHAHQQTNVWVA